MEQLLILLVMAIPAAILGGFIAAFVALARTSRLRRQVADLELRVGGLSGAALERRVRELERRVGAVDAAPAAAEVVEEPAEQAVRTPPPAPPVVPPEVPAGVPAPAPPPSPAAAAAPWRAPGPPADRERPPAPTPPEDRPLPASPKGPPAGRGRVDWEQWVGVRGAAVLGACALALAGLLFFKYSIDHGLISPAMRVMLGLLAGVACTVGSEPLRRRGQPFAADGLAGAGVVILYASVWAARTLYGLIGWVPAFALMTLITLTCGLLALRRRSLLVAVLGLIGGFATPALVSAGVDRPVALFSYLLILNVGLLLLAARRRWPVVGLLCLAGTALHQASWVLGSMDRGGVGVGLAVLGLFAGVFLVFGGRLAESSAVWRTALMGALLVPFSLALHVAGSTSLGEHLWPVGVLSLLLCGGACWVGRRLDRAALAYAAVGGGVATVAVWLASRAVGNAEAWEAVVVSVGLTAVFLLAAELRRPEAGRAGSCNAAVASATLLLGVLALSGAVHEADLWPWLVGWVLLVAALERLASTPGRAWVQLVAAGGAVGGLGLFALSRAVARAQGVAAADVAVAVGLAVGFQVVAVARREGRPRLWAEHTAASAALGLVATPCLALAGEVTALPLAAALLLGLLAVLAATRLGSGAWYLAAVAVSALCGTVWTAAAGRSTLAEIGAAGLALQGSAVVVLTFWPLLAGRGLRACKGAWYGAAAAGPAFFLSLRYLWEVVLGEGAIGVLPVLLALVSLAAVVTLRQLWREPTSTRASAVAWLMAVALLFVSVAIPLQLEKMWITVGWALNGVAVLALWRRLDHPGLKYLSLTLMAVTTVRLVANPAVLEYYPRGGLPVLNWVLYAYLVPAACLVGAAALLRGLEVGRLRSWESGLYLRPRPWAASFCGLAAVAVVFVWINLAIADVFSQGSQLVLSFDRMPARDMATSIAWAVYALILLSLGMWRQSVPLRWLSLALLVATIAKVFLHDLGELRDLYRVASLLGLALSLIVVSLAYQRFVLRRPTEPS